MNLNHARMPIPPQLLAACCIISFISGLVNHQLYIISKNFNYLSCSILFCICPGSRVRFGCSCRCTIFKQELPLCLLPKVPRFFCENSHSAHWNGHFAHPISQWNGVPHGGIGPVFNCKNRAEFLQKLLEPYIQKIIQSKHQVSQTVYIVKHLME